MIRVCIPSVVLVAAIAGCATVDPAADFARTAELVTQSTGVAVSIDGEAAGVSDEEVRLAMADGLSLEESLRFALGNSRRLHAELMRIGVKKADWVQSGLLKNPSLSAAVMFPIGGGRSDITASLAQNILDLWRIPIRKRGAQHELDEAVLSIARLAGELAADVKRAYFEAAAAEQTLAVTRENLEITRRSLSAVSERLSGGVATGLDENLARGQSLSAELAVRSARLEAANARRRLARLMSVDAAVDEVKLTDGLTPGRLAPVDAEQLIATARLHRLDLQAARSAVQASGADLALERTKAVGDVMVGGGVERMERRGGSGEGIDVMAGPMISLELPIFDQNQAQVAKAGYLRRRAQLLYEELDRAIGQEVRTAADRAATATDSLAFYREKLMPQATSGFELAGDSFRAGRTSILNLLESQRSLLEARRGLIMLEQELAVAVSELERAVGRPLE